MSSAFIDGAMHCALMSGDLAKMKAAAPRIPEETCPTIDTLREVVGGVGDSLDTIRDQVERSRARTLKSEGILDEFHDLGALIAGVKLRLEDLRTDNDQLRRSSYFWYQAAKRLAGRLA
jgi:hypothetical protein